LFGSETNSSGWELALVTAPSSNTSHVVESKLVYISECNKSTNISISIIHCFLRDKLHFAQQAGGFDKLLLDSLYEDATRRQQIAAANPFQAQDPFAMSNNIAPPPNVQMAIMAQQQQQYYYQQQQQQQQQQQMMMMVPHTYQPHYNPPSQIGAANPFGDPLVGFGQPAPQHGHSSLI